MYTHFISVVKDQPGLSPEDKVLAVSSVSFDIAILETLVSPGFRAQTHLLGQMERKEPDINLDKLVKEEISLMFVAPSHWKMLLLNGLDRKFGRPGNYQWWGATGEKLADRLLPFARSYGMCMVRPKPPFILPSGGFASDKNSEPLENQWPTPRIHYIGC